MTFETLSHLHVLKITGDDALDFLQGQLTNDVTKLENKWQFSGYCNPKGRLLALFLLWRDTNAIYAVVDASLVDIIVKRLRMYVMRSKVLIEYLDAARCYGALPDKRTNTEELTPAKVIETSDNTSNALQANTVLANNEVLKNGSYSRLKINNRCLIVSEDGETDNNPWLENDTLISADAWLRAEIHDGLPWVSNQTLELFIPQMVNLDLLGGIDFKKGCYTGQEIVARMHYLGKLKQRMFVCELDGDASSPSIGDNVLLNDSLGKSVGTVINAIAGFSTILAVLRLDALEDLNDATTQLVLKNGGALTLKREQPYRVI